MNVEKIRNLTDAELKQQERELMDQLFRLKFQMKMGQTESLNKIRELRKSVARVKTIHGERASGKNVAVQSAAPQKVAAQSAAPKKAAAKKSEKK